MYTSLATALPLEHRRRVSTLITFEDVAFPKHGDDEVLVRVYAAGVGNWDALIRSGRSGVTLSLPLTLGAELAGTVEAVGACETELQLGDDVFGARNDLFIGAYAEYAIASRHKIARKPQSLDYVASASAPTAAVTAW